MKNFLGVIWIIVVAAVTTVFGQTYTLYNSTNSDLPYDAVYCIFADKDGKIWFGGQRDAATGIAKVSTYDPLSNSWKIWSDTELGLDQLEDRVFYIAHDGDGNMWFCTHYGVSLKAPDGTINTFFINDYTRTVFSDSRGNIYVSNRDSSAIFVTSNSGQTWIKWTQETLGMPSTDRPEIYDLTETADGRLWICTWYGVYYKNADNTFGVVSDIQGYFTYAMTKDPNDNLWVPDNDTKDLYKINPQDGTVTIYDSTDADILKYTINDLEADAAGNLWLATDGSGLVKLNPSDFSYEVFNSSSTTGQIPENVITHLQINNNELWLSTASKGIVRIQGILPTGVDEELTPVKNFELIGNYPNPFNPVTNIVFSVPGKSRVKLQVYNLAGQLIATLIDGELPAGKHQIAWTGTDENGRPVPSGVYICRLERKDQSLSKKMVLIK